MKKGLEPAPTEHHPPFNEWRGGLASDVSGPLEFDKVVMRYFPLEADVQALGRFCDTYLNESPFERFKPAMPYVVACVANYGSMSVASGNLGWEAQNEVLFGVPVEWQTLDADGNMVFNAFAMVAPFIYVDSGASESGGREVFGWPKVHGWFSPSVSQWTRNPRDWRTLLTVKMQGFGELFAGETIGAQELLSIEEKPPISYTLFPPSVREADSILTELPRSVLSWGNVFAHAASSFAPQIFGGMGVGSIRAINDFMKLMLHPSKGFVGAFHANTVNLKQMRDARDPRQACYQGYTNAQMEVKRIRRGGLLGESQVRLGDPSGGLRFRIRDLSTQPIIQTLGLQTIEEIREGDDHISTLKPVLPFWVEADMKYTGGKTLCWRTPNQAWRNDKFQQTGGPQKVPYNTTGSAGYQVPVGPFVFPNSTFRVLPLLADGNTMQKFVDRYLNDCIDDAGETSFQAYGSYVYLVVSNFEDMSSEWDNIGVWAKSGMDFLVPVLWSKNGQLQSAGVVSPFMFAETDIGVTTAREVNGWPTVIANLQRPPNPWGSEGGPFADVVELLNMHTDALPIIGLGQEVEWDCVVQILDGHPFDANDDEIVRSLAENWGKSIKENVSDLATRAHDEKSSHRYLALAAEIIGNQVPLNQFSLKQFREASDFKSACYQAVVRSPSKIVRWHELREIERAMYIKIHHFETLPIIEMLGLKTVLDSKDGSYSVLQPQRPFFMQVDLRTEFGELLCQRSGTLKWHNGEAFAANRQFFDPAHWPEKEGGAGRSIDLGVGVVEALDDDKANPILATKGWRRTSSEEDLMKLKRASDTAKNFEPQMAIHEVLSRRWGDSCGTEHSPSKPPSYLVRNDCVGKNPPSWLFPTDEVGLVDGNKYWSPDPWKENNSGE